MTAKNAKEMKEVREPEQLELFDLSKVEAVINRINIESEVSNSKEDAKKLKYVMTFNRIFHAIHDLTIFPYATSSVLHRIIEERARQDAKWGVTRHSDSDWLAILMEEVGELSKEIVEGNTHKDKLNELIQIAAVCVAWAVINYGDDLIADDMTRRGIGDEQDEK